MKQRIILFDGLCNFCNSWVNLILRHDNQNKFDLISLHTEKGKLLLRQIGFHEHFMDSIILIEDDKYLIKSDAVLKIITAMKGLWKMGYLLYIVPRKIRNRIYDLIASKRHKLHPNKADSCKL